jgi:hypothetical protein
VNKKLGKSPQIFQQDCWKKPALWKNSEWWWDLGLQISPTRKLSRSPIGESSESLRKNNTNSKVKVRTMSACFFDIKGIVHCDLVLPEQIVRNSTKKFMAVHILKKMKSLIRQVHIVLWHCTFPPCTFSKAISGQNREITILEHLLYLPDLALWILMPPPHQKNPFEPVLFWITWGHS